MAVNTFVDSNDKIGLFNKDLDDYNFLTIESDERIYNERNNVIPKFTANFLMSDIKRTFER